MRLRNRARATKDIDLALRLPDADLVLTLERALTGDPYQGFSFRRKREPLLLDNGVVNMEFAVSYRGGMDSCVMTRPSPRTSAASTASTDAKINARARSRRSHKAMASRTASSWPCSRPLAMAVLC